MKIQALAISLHVSAEQSKNLFVSRSVSDRVDTSFFIVECVVNMIESYQASFPKFFYSMRLA